MDIATKELTAALYENFIRRAFKTNDDSHGGHADYFRLFADTDEDEEGDTMNPSFADQWHRITDSLLAATQKFLEEKKLKPNERERLISLKKRLLEIKNADDYIDILEEAINLTDRFK